MGGSCSRHEGGLADRLEGDEDEDRVAGGLGVAASRDMQRKYPSSAFGPMVGDSRAAGGLDDSAGRSSKADDSRGSRDGGRGGNGHGGHHEHDEDEGCTVCNMQRKYPGSAFGPMISMVDSAIPAMLPSGVPPLPTLVQNTAAIQFEEKLGALIEKDVADKSSSSKGSKASDSSWDPNTLKYLKRILKRRDRRFSLRQGVVQEPAPGMKPAKVKTEKRKLPPPLESVSPGSPGMVEQQFEPIEHSGHPSPQLVPEPEVVQPSGYMPLQVVHGQEVVQVAVDTEVPITEVAPALTTLVEPPSPIAAIKNQPDFLTHAYSPETTSYSTQPTSTSVPTVSEFKTEPAKSIGEVSPAVEVYGIQSPSKFDELSSREDEKLTKPTITEEQNDVISGATDSVESFAKPQFTRLSEIWPKLTNDISSTHNLASVEPVGLEEFLDESSDPSDLKTKALVREYLITPVTKVPGENSELQELLSRQSSAGEDPAGTKKKVRHHSSSLPVESIMGLPRSSHKTSQSEEPGDLERPQPIFFPRVKKPYLTETLDYDGPEVFGLLMSMILQRRDRKSGDSNPASCSEVDMDDQELSRRDFSQVVKSPAFESAPSTLYFTPYSTAMGTVESQEQSVLSMAPASTVVKVPSVASLDQEQTRATVSMTMTSSISTPAIVKEALAMKEIQQPVGSELSATADVDLAVPVLDVPLARDPLSESCESVSGPTPTALKEVQALKLLDAEVGNTRTSGSISSFMSAMETAPESPLPEDLTAPTLLMSGLAAVETAQAVMKLQTAIDDIAQAILDVGPTAEDVAAAFEDTSSSRSEEIGEIEESAWPITNGAEDIPGTEFVLELEQSQGKQEAIPEQGVEVEPEHFDDIESYESLDAYADEAPAFYVCSEAESVHEAELDTSDTESPMSDKAKPMSVLEPVVESHQTKEDLEDRELEMEEPTFEGLQLKLEDVEDEQSNETDESSSSQDYEPAGIELELDDFEDEVVPSNPAPSVRSPQEEMKMAGFEDDVMAYGRAMNEGTPTSLPTPRAGISSMMGTLPLLVRPEDVSGTETYKSASLSFVQNLVEEPGSYSSEQTAMISPNMVLSYTIDSDSAVNSNGPRIEKPRLETADEILDELSGAESLEQVEAEAEESAGQQEDELSGGEEDEYPEGFAPETQGGESYTPTVFRNLLGESTSVLAETSGKFFTSMSAHLSKGATNIRNRSPMPYTPEWIDKTRRPPNEVLFFGSTSAVSTSKEIPHEIETDAEDGRSGVQTNMDATTTATPIRTVVSSSTPWGVTPGHESVSMTNEQSAIAPIIVREDNQAAYFGTSPDPFGIVGIAASIDESDYSSSQSNAEPPTMFAEVPVYIPKTTAESAVGAGYVVGSMMGMPESDELATVEPSAMVSRTPTMLHEDGPAAIQGMMGIRPDWRADRTYISELHTQTVAPEFTSNFVPQSADEITTRSQAIGGMMGLSQEEQEQGPDFDQSTRSFGNETTSDKQTASIPTFMHGVPRFYANRFQDLKTEADTLTTGLTTKLDLNHERDELTEEEFLEDQPDFRLSYEEREISFGETNRVAEFSANMGLSTIAESSTPYTASTPGAYKDGPMIPGNELESDDEAANSIGQPTTSPTYINIEAVPEELMDEFQTDLLASTALKSTLDTVVDSLESSHRSQVSAFNVDPVPFPRGAPAPFSNVHVMAYSESDVSEGQDDISSQMRSSADSEMPNPAVKVEDLTRDSEKEGSLFAGFSSPPYIVTEADGSYPAISGLGVPSTPKVVTSNAARESTIPASSFISMEMTLPSHSLQSHMINPQDSSLSSSNLTRSSPPMQGLHQDYQVPLDLQVDMVGIVPSGNGGLEEYGEFSEAGNEAGAVLSQIQSAHTAANSRINHSGESPSSTRQQVEEKVHSEAVGAIFGFSPGITHPPETSDTTKGSQPPTFFPQAGELKVLQCVDIPSYKPSKSGLQSPEELESIHTMPSMNDMMASQHPAATKRSDEVQMRESMSGWNSEDQRVHIVYKAAKSSTGAEDPHSSSVAETSTDVPSIGPPPISIHAAMNANQVPQQPDNDCCKCVCEKFVPQMVTRESDVSDQLTVSAPARLEHGGSQQLSDYHNRQVAFKEFQQQPDVGNLVLPGAEEVLLEATPMDAMEPATLHETTTIPTPTDMKETSYKSATSGYQQSDGQRHGDETEAAAMVNQPPTKSATESITIVPSHLAPTLYDSSLPDLTSDRARIPLRLIVTPASELEAQKQQIEQEKQSLEVVRGDEESSSLMRKAADLEKPTSIATHYSPPSNFDASNMDETPDEIGQFGFHEPLDPSTRLEATDYQSRSLPRSSKPEVAFGGLSAEALDMQLPGTIAARIPPTEEALSEESSQMQMSRPARHSEVLRPEILSGLMEQEEVQDDQRLREFVKERLSMDEGMGKDSDRKTVDFSQPISYEQADEIDDANFQLVDQTVSEPEEKSDKDEQLNEDKPESFLPAKKSSFHYSMDTSDENPFALTQTGTGTVTGPTMTYAIQGDLSQDDEASSSTTMKQISQMENMDNGETNTDGGSQQFLAAVQASSMTRFVQDGHVQDIYEEQFRQEDFQDVDTPVDDISIKQDTFQKMPDHQFRLEEEPQFKREEDQEFKQEEAHKFRPEKEFHELDPPVSNMQSHEETKIQEMNDPQVWQEEDQRTRWGEGQQFTHEDQLQELDAPSVDSKSFEENKFLEMHDQQIRQEADEQLRQEEQSQEVDGAVDVSSLEEAKFQEMYDQRFSQDDDQQLSYGEEQQTRQEEEQLFEPKDQLKEVDASVDNKSSFEEEKFQEMYDQQFRQEEDQETWQEESQQITAAEEQFQEVDAPLEDKSSLEAEKFQEMYDQRFSQEEQYQASDAPMDITPSVEPNQLQQLVNLPSDQEEPEASFDDQRVLHQQSTTEGSAGYFESLQQVAADTLKSIFQKIPSVSSLYAEPPNKGSGKKERKSSSGEQTRRSSEKTEAHEPPVSPVPMVHETQSDRVTDVTEDNILPPMYQPEQAAVTAEEPDQLQAPHSDAPDLSTVVPTWVDPDEARSPSSATPTYWARKDDLNMATSVNNEQGSISTALPDWEIAQEHESSSLTSSSTTSLQPEAHGETLSTAEGSWKEPQDELNNADQQEQQGGGAEVKPSTSNENLASTKDYSKSKRLEARLRTLLQQKHHSQHLTSSVSSKRHSHVTDIHSRPGKVAYSSQKSSEGLASEGQKSLSQQSSLATSLLDSPTSMEASGMDHEQSIPMEVPQTIAEEALDAENGRNAQHQEEPMLNLADNQELPLQNAVEPKEQNQEAQSINNGTIADGNELVQPLTTSQSTIGPAGAQLQEVPMQSVAEGQEPVEPDGQDLKDDESSSRMIVDGTELVQPFTTSQSSIAEAYGREVPVKKAPCSTPDSPMFKLNVFGSDHLIDLSSDAEDAPERSKSATCRQPIDRDEEVSVLGQSSAPPSTTSIVDSPLSDEMMEESSYGYCEANEVALQSMTSTGKENSANSGQHMTSTSIETGKTNPNEFDSGFAGFTGNERSNAQVEHDDGRTDHGMNMGMTEEPSLSMSLASDNSQKRSETSIATEHVEQGPIIMASEEPEASSLMQSEERQDDDVEEALEVTALAQDRAVSESYHDDEASSRQEETYDERWGMSEVREDRTKMVRTSGTQSHLSCSKVAFDETCFCDEAQEEMVKDSEMAYQQQLSRYQSEFTPPRNGKLTSNVAGGVPNRTSAPMTPGKSGQHVGEMSPLPTPTRFLSSAATMDVDPTTTTTTNTTTTGVESSSFFLRSSSSVFKPLSSDRHSSASAAGKDTETVSELPFIPRLHSMFSDHAKYKPLFDAVERAARIETERRKSMEGSDSKRDVNREESMANLFARGVPSAPEEAPRINGRKVHRLGRLHSVVTEGYDGPVDFGFIIQGDEDEGADEGKISAAGPEHDSGFENADELPLLRKHRRRIRWLKRPYQAGLPAEMLLAPSGDALIATPRTRVVERTMSSNSRIQIPEADIKTCPISRGKRRSSSAGRTKTSRSASRTSRRVTNKKSASLMPNVSASTSSHQKLKSSVRTKISRSGSAASRTNLSDNLGLKTVTNKTGASRSGSARKPAKKSFRKDKIDFGDLQMDSHHEYRLIVPENDSSKTSTGRPVGDESRGDSRNRSRNHSASTSKVSSNANMRN